MAAGLSADPGGLRALAPETQRRVVGFLFECACMAQNEEAIRMGTSYLRRVPRSLAIAGIRTEMTNPELLEDEYAYRRLLTLCECFDPPWVPQVNSRHELVRAAIDAGLASGDSEVKAVAASYADRLSAERTPTGAIESPSPFVAMVHEQSDPLRLVA